MLNRVLQKSWSKIGKYKQHTYNRLQKYQILKLEDELSIQELKFIWKWEHNKTPTSLKKILKAKKEDRLQGRRFEMLPNNKPSSIHYRLIKCANDNIKTISNIKSKKVLVKIQRKSILGNKYKFRCTVNNCKCKNC